MKKTLTVNLGGTVYQIDEDAYSLLDAYLCNLRYHFRREADADEIVRDMEARIGELCGEYLREGNQVITVCHVEEIIRRMGKPEELNSRESGSAADEDTGRASRPAGKRGRRLFRDPDNHVLGGICGGLGAYFGWDPTWIRLGMLALGFCFHGLILVYLLAWIIIPLARTATEKLQMRGEPVSVESIGKTVTGGFETGSEQVCQTTPDTVLHRIGSAIVAVAGFVIKLCLIVLAICCFPILLICALVIVIFFLSVSGVIAGIPSFLYACAPEIDWGTLVHTAPLMLAGMLVCALMVVGIPLAGMLQLIMQGFGIWKPVGITARVVLMLVWLSALCVGMVLFVCTGYGMSDLITV